MRITTLVTASLLAGASLVTVKTHAADAWTDRITLGADIRLRQERIYTEGIGGGADNRTRLKARLMVTGKVEDNLTANIRIGTGDPAANGAGPLVSLDNFTGGGGRKAIWLEIANMDWSLMDGFNIALGKNPNPYWTAGNSALVFDPNVTMEGVTVKYAMDLGSMKPFANASYTAVNNTAPTAAGAAEQDVSLAAIQLGVTGKMDPLWWTVAVSKVDYNGVKGTAGIGQFGFAGNAATAGAYDFDYKLLNAGLEVGVDVAGMPIKGFYDYVTNSDPSSLNVGALAGVRVNQLKDTGSWAAEYSYRDVQRDAVLGAQSDIEFGGGENGTRGHKVWVGYQLSKATTVAAGYFANTLRTHLGSAPGGSIAHERMYLDVAATF